MKQPTQVHHGFVKDGQLVLADRETFLKLVKKLEGEAIEVTIAKARVTRSISQNKYYWAVVVQLMAEHCGYEPEEMHDALKHKFLHIHDDSTLPTTKSTASLDTEEFTVYIDCCIRLAAEMGVVIPEARNVNE